MFDRTSMPDRPFIWSSRCPFGISMNIFFLKTEQGSDNSTIKMFAALNPESSMDTTILEEISFKFMMVILFFRRMNWDIRRSWVLFSDTIRSLTFWTLHPYPTSNCEVHLCKSVEGPVGDIIVRHPQGNCSGFSLSGDISVRAGLSENERVLECRANHVGSSFGERWKLQQDDELRVMQKHAVGT